MAYQGAAAALALLLAACTVPKEVNPVEIYRQVSGAADRGRPAPPGLDQPFPNLAVVPPRPERPPLAARDAVSGTLAADRSSARTPLEPGEAEAREPVFAAAPGTPPLPPGPPPRAALAGVAPIPWDAPPGPAGAGAAAARPLPPGGTPGTTMPVMPAAPPAAPPADLLGPLPSAGPPPPPPPDLLGPAPRR